MNILKLNQSKNDKKKGQTALSSNLGNLADMQSAMRNQALETSTETAWEKYVNGQKKDRNSILRQFSSFKPLKKAQDDLAKISQETQNYLTPFGIEELDTKYQNTVRMLGNIQSKNGGELNPMQDAYDLTVRYVQTAMASDELTKNSLARRDPKAVGNEEFNRSLQDTINKYRYSGASAEELAQARENRLKIGREEQAAADNKLISEALRLGAKPSALNTVEETTATQLERLGKIADNVAWNGGAYALSQEEAAVWQLANRTLAGQGIDTTNWTERQWQDYGNTEAGKLRQQNAKPLTRNEADAYLQGQGWEYGFAREHAGDLSGYVDAFNRAGDIINKVKSRGFKSLNDTEKDVYNVMLGQINDSYGVTLDELTGEDILELSSDGKARAQRLKDVSGLYLGKRKDPELDAINKYYGQTLEGAKALAAESEGTEDEQKWKDNLWFLERKTHYDDVASRADFGEISQVNPDHFNAKEYARVNGQQPTIDPSRMLPTTANPYGVTLGDAETRFNVDQMTDEERAMYNAIVNTEGLVEGGKYLDYLQYQLDQRAAEQTGKAFYDLGQQGVWGATAASVLSVPASLMRGAGYLDVMGQRLANDISGDYKPINTSTAWQLPGVIADQSRQGVQDQVDWTANILGNDVDLFDFFYGTAMSGVDSLAAGATGIGGQLLGLGAAQSAMQDAYKAGANDRQALMTGTVAGIFETIFESISIERFYDEAKHLGKRDFKEHVKNILAQSGINFSEEFNTELANMISEEAIMGTKAQTQKQRDEYIRLGLTEEEADARIAQEKTLRLLEAGFGGALMGGAFGAVSNVTSDARTGSLDKKVGGYFDAETGKLLKEMGSHLPVGQANGLANKYNPATATNKQTGALVRAIMQELPREMRGTLRSQLGAVLVQNDSNISADAADALLTMLSGQELSGEQIDALAGSKAGMKAVYDLMGVNGDTGRALDKNRGQQQGQALELESMPTLAEPEQARRDVPPVYAAKDDDMLRKSAQIGENAAETQREPEPARRDVEKVERVAGDDMLRTEAKTGENAAGMQREPEQPRRNVEPVEKIAGDDMLKSPKQPIMYTGKTQEARRNVEQVEAVKGDDMLKAVTENGENVTENAENAGESSTGRTASLEKRQGIMGFSVDRESGGVVAKMEDGSTQDVDSLDVSDDEKTLAQEAADMDERAQAGMMRNYKPEKGGAVQYARGYKAVYRAAQKGATEAGVKSIYADDLDAEARADAYEAGHAAYEAEEAQAAEDTRKSAADAQKRYGHQFAVLADGKTRRGGVYLARVRNGLTSTQSTMLQLIETVAEESGAQVRVYDTMGQENGNYQTGSNIINVALDAEGGMLTRTVTHELFHFIREWNSEAGVQLQKTAIAALEKAEGYDLQKRREQVAKQYRDAKGQALDADAIDEEIAAEAMLDQIGTEEGVKSLIKTTAKTDERLLKKIGDWISGTVQKLRTAMESIGRNHAEVRALSGDVDYFARIAEQFKEAARVAGENYRAAQRGMNQTAAQDSDIKQYNQDMRQAATPEDAQTARDGLAGHMYARMIQATGNTELDYDAFVSALTAFGSGQMGSLNGAMQQRGLPNVPENLNSVMSYAARQISEGMRLREAAAESAAAERREADRQEIEAEETQEQEARQAEAQQAEAPQAAQEAPEEVQEAQETQETPEAEQEKAPWTAPKPIEETYHGEQATKKKWKGAAYVLNFAEANPAEAQNRTMQVTDAADGTTKEVTFAEFAEKFKQAYNREYKVKKVQWTEKGKGLFGWAYNKVHTGWAVETKGKYDDSMPVDLGVWKTKERAKNRMNQALQFMERYDFSGLDFSGIAEGTQENALAGTEAESAEGEMEEAASLKGYDGNKIGLKEPIEETKDLIAVHNVLSMKLDDIINLGGLPMPSIAIIRKDIGYSRFGDVSFIFDKDTIDPAEPENKVYGNDSWTPTFDDLDIYEGEDGKKYIHRWGNYGKEYDDSGVFAYEYDMDFTAENVADAMIEIGEKEQAPISAKAAKLYASLDDVRNDRGRLQAITEEDNKERKKALRDHEQQLAEDITNHVKERDSETFGDIEALVDNIEKGIKDAGRAYAKKGTVQAIKDAMYNASMAEITDAEAEQIEALIKEAREMPTRYFEAKPERVVELAEIQRAVVPDTTSAETIQRLKDAGVQEVVTYPRGDQESRKAAINERQDLMFELRGDTDADTEAAALEDVRDDAELYAQMNMDEDARAALMMLRQLHRLTTQGGQDALIQKGAFEKRLSDIVGKIEEQTGTKYGPNKLRNALRKIYGAMEQNDYKLGEILQYARDVMQEVLEAAPGVLVENDESTQEAMRIIRTRPFYLSAEQKSEIQGTYGSVADFRRKNFGKMKIRKQDAKTASLADVWREDLAPLMPGTFDADTNELDMPAILDAWLENANTKKFAGEFGRNIGAYSTNLALNAMLDFYDVPGALKTKADIREGFRERINQQEAEIQQLKTTAREAVNKAAAEYNERYKQRIEKAQARREQTERKKELRGKISRDVKAINTLNVSMTDTRHVPESMRAAALAAVEPFISGSGVFSGAAQIRLAHEYELLKQRAGEIGGFDEDILESINGLGERLNGRRLSDLSEEELQEIADITGNLHKLIVDENAAFLNGRKTTIDELSGQLKADMRQRGNARQGKLAELVRGISLKETTPTYFADRVGGVIRDMIRNLYAGQNTWAFTMKAAKEFLGENGTGITDRKKQSGVYAKYHVNEWINDKNHAKFTTQHGDWIELNRQEALSLYALWKRETTNKLQNANHLRVGGFMYQKGTKYENVDTLRPHPLTESDMQMIRSYLTEEQKAFADEMVRYLSEDMARIGNEVSMRLYGYEKFKEGYYFPYDTDHRYLVGDLTQDGERVKQPKSAGMTKALMQNAATPITVKDFTETWANHVNQMALYAGFAEGIDTMSRVFNQRVSGEVRLDSVTGEEFVISPESNWIEMERAIGAEGVKYLKTLARDVSGGVRADERSPIGKGLSLFKKGAVVGSLSVVVQQPTAYARAMLMVNPRYLASAVLPQNLAKLPKNIQNMYKYSGVALIKDMGRFDTGTGRGAVAWLQDTIREDNLGRRALDTIDTVTGIGAEKADEWTWGILWGAIENETKHTRADLEAGSEEFYQAVAERFEDVCNHTQVYDSVLSKSEWMRSGSTMDKMVTSFMAEPTLTLNMLQDSIVNFKTNGGSRKVARAAAAFLVNSALTALAKSIVTATRRKDDEGRTWLEKYLAESAGNFMDDISPFGLVSMIPWARDAVSLLEGYSVERSDMDAMEQLVNAWKTVQNDNKSLEDKLQAVSGAVGNLFGIPVKNLWRDTEAILRNMFGGASANEPTTWRDIKYSVMDETGLAIPFTGDGFGAWDSKRAAYYDRMADAILRGDADKYAELRGYTEETNQVKADTVTSGVKSALKERVLSGQITPEEAERALIDGLGMEAGKAFNAVDEWKQTREHADEEGWKYSKYNNFLSMVETGEGLRDEIKRLMDGGTSAETLSGQITSHFKPLYIEAYNRDKTEAARMKAYILNAYVMLGYDHDKKQKDVEKWLK